MAQHESVLEPRLKQQALLPSLLRFISPLCY